MLEETSQRLHEEEQRSIICEMYENQVGNDIPWPAYIETPKLIQGLPQ